MVLAITVSGCGLFGKRPAPIDPLTGATQTGIASWYGPGFHGRRTANGEIYDQFALTAAHQTLPHGTLLRVTNLTNQRAVQVRVNDRGPFVDDRIIDLSYNAARQLDMIGPGVVPVRLDVLGGGGPEPVQLAAAPPPAPVRPQPAAPVSVPPASPQRRASGARQGSQAAVPPPPPAAYAVQVGAFTDYRRARQAQLNLAERGARAQLALIEAAGQRYYRLRLGPFAAHEQAAQSVRRIADLGFPALIVADGAARN